MSLSISNDTVNQEDETNLSIVSGASNKRNENNNTNTFTNHNNISHIRNSNHNSHTNGNSNNGNRDNNNFRVPTLPPHHSNHLNYSTLSGSFSDRAERAGDRERDRERDRDRGGADDFRASFDVNSSFASTFTSDSRTSDRGDRGGGGERERGDRERGEKGIGGERGGGGGGDRERDGGDRSDRSDRGENRGGKGPRPLPDQSAFDRSLPPPARTDSPGVVLGGMGSKTPLRSVCPATPMRTPSWCSSRDRGERGERELERGDRTDRGERGDRTERADRGGGERERGERGKGGRASVGIIEGDRGGIFGGGGERGAGGVVGVGDVPDSDELHSERSFSTISSHAALLRNSSLTSNRVLISLSDSINTDEISFHRDFDHEGFLGAGTFADVYKAREKDGKLYAVKRSKRQFRSEKDRAVLIGEVMVMKRLGELPCDYIVRLVRAWQEDGYFFVQIDLAERGTLKDLLTSCAVSDQVLLESTVWHIVHDVSAGLQHIHNCGVVHLGECLEGYC